MEIIHTILPYISQFLGGTVAIGIVLAVVARVIPNEKLYAWGYKLGVMGGAFGSLKVGRGWNAIEGFLINSLGELFRGIKDGLTSDDSGDPQQPSNNDGNPDVRI